MSSLLWLCLTKQPQIMNKLHKPGVLPDSLQLDYGASQQFILRL